VQLDLPFLRSSRPIAQPDPGVEFIRTRRARRYILRVKPDGTIRVTIPRSGSRSEAIGFMQRHVGWIAKERARVRRDQAPVRWTDGSTILLDGEVTTIAVRRTGESVTATYGTRVVRVKDVSDVRPCIERDLRDLARERLVPRLRALAAGLDLTVTRVTIRNQRSRWGSCSRAGAIALNFRLVQMPPSVWEYVLVHELMHLTQQNHGPRFWTLVQRVCPSFQESERWLRTTGRSLF